MSVVANRKRVLALGALILIAGFGFIGLQAADALSTTTTLSAPNPVPNPPLSVAEANRDASGAIRVHEQGTVQVQGTVNVGNAPTVQDVRITNTPVQVTGNVNVRAGTAVKLFQEVYPFTEVKEIEVDISEFSRVRLRFVVNGAEDSTVEFHYHTDAGISDDFSLDTGDSKGVLLPEVAGTKLRIVLDDPDGEQVFVEVFGTR
jgi:hypothetical protein